MHLLGALLVLTGIAAAARQTPVANPLPVELEPHHHLVLKNDSVLVMHVTLQPGESTLFHNHSHDRAAVDIADAVIAFQQQGEAEGVPASTRPGDFSVSSLSDSGYTHRVHNVGPTTFEVIDVELLQRPRLPSSPAAAPVAGENPSARVYNWVLAPGATSEMHTHERPYLIIAATMMQLKMTAPDGKSLTEEVKPGDVHWVDSKVSHSLTNQGTTEGHILEIELK